jgi:hypothetical protein
MYQSGDHLFVLGFASVVADADEHSPPQVYVYEHWRAYKRYE